MGPEVHEEAMKTHRKLEQATRRWLALERSGQDPAAEDSLERVFRLLPMPVPSSALARRTLARLGFDATLAAPLAAPHWAFRWAVAMALLISGLATALYTPTLVAAIGLKGGANWVVDLGAGFLAAVFRRLAAVVAVWDVVSRAAVTAAEVVATPQVLGLMLVTVLFALATFRVLAGIVVFERSSYHA